MKTPARKYLCYGLAYGVLDLLAIGAGMGIPIFAILLGFIVGWAAPTLARPHSSNDRDRIRLSVLIAGLTSGFTMLVMAVLWGPSMILLTGPNADIANFGIPMILYDPAASFIGWLVLMIFLSPFFQMLAAVFAATVRIAWFPPSPGAFPQESPPRP
jgi:hypothetical protein